MFVGGGSKIAGLYEYVTKKIDAPIIIAEEPADSVVQGAAKLLGKNKEFIKIEFSSNSSLFSNSTTQKRYAFTLFYSYRKRRFCHMLFRYYVSYNDMSIPHICRNLHT